MAVPGDSIGRGKETGPPRGAGAVHWDRGREEMLQVEELGVGFWACGV